MTPALRVQRQNIPILAMHFLQEGEHMAGRSGLALSRGALKTLVSYDWPGNIRELKHVIITAAVMSEGRVIQAEQLGISSDGSDRAEALETEGYFREEQGAAGQREERVEARPTENGLPGDLNDRQLLALEHVRRYGSISSKDLMELRGGEISKRTAGYDIQDLVARGLLRRVGRGPATHYVLAGKDRAQ
jgi:DNA-binding NtrC family response regulator